MSGGLRKKNGRWRAVSEDTGPSTDPRRCITHRSKGSLVMHSKKWKDRRKADPPSEWFLSRPSEIANRAMFGTDFSHLSAPVKGGTCTVRFLPFPPAPVLERKTFTTGYLPSQGSHNVRKVCFVNPRVPLTALPRTPNARPPVWTISTFGLIKEWFFRKQRTQRGLRARSVPDVGRNPGLPDLPLAWRQPDAAGSEKRRALADESQKRARTAIVADSEKS